MAPSPSRQLPKVAVVGCGGTIASIGTDSLDVVDYPELGQKIPVPVLLARVPEAARIAQIHAVDFRAVSSSAIGPREWFELRDKIDRLANEGVAGIVILHGTGTLEETAFFLHLTLDAKVPVVLTGAQRPVSAVSSDAGMNLVSALRIASDPTARGKGVLVALNDEIYPARDVVKLSTFRLQTFQAPGLGPIGHVDGDGVFFRRTLTTSGGAFESIPAPNPPPMWPRVDIIYSYAGSDGLFIETAIKAGARGIVSAGFAPGITTPDERRLLLAAREAGLTVVQCSRATGRVASRQYLEDKGIISGEDLSPQKARILLSLCLAVNFDHERIARAFLDC